MPCTSWHWQQANVGLALLVFAVVCCQLPCADQQAGKALIGQALVRLIRGQPRSVAAKHCLLGQFAAARGHLSSFPASKGKLSV